MADSEAQADPTDGPTEDPVGDIAQPRREQYTPRPRWVTALLVLAAVVVIVLLVALASGTGHGPGRHLGIGR